MRTLEQLQERLAVYGNAEFIYRPNLGYIAWHYSTGENIEILFIEAIAGYGTYLYVDMVKKVLSSSHKPYNSVFGFRIKSNERAGRFYAGLGWTQVDLGRSIYAGEDTIIMWCNWEEFVRRLRL